MIHRSEVRWAGAIVMIFLVTAACGSTVPLDQQETAQEVAQLGGDLGGTPLPPGTTVNDKGQVVDASGDVIGTLDESGDFVPTTGGASGPQVSGGGASGGQGGGGGTTTAAGANGPGVTSDAVHFGVIEIKGGDEANAAIGASGATQADMRDVWTALTEEANADGGLLGRDIVPVFHEIDANSTQSGEQQGEEACADWTQDRPVFATHGRATFFEPFITCMERAGAVIASGGAFSSADERIYERHPYLFEMNTMDLNTQGKLLVNGLYAQKYFGSAPKIGLVTFDDPNFQYATQRSLIPALDAKGLSLATEPAYVTTPRTNDQYAQTAQDCRNAVLRFSSEGITHVMLLDFGGAIALTCLPSAQSQQFRPRYGITSQSAPTLLARQLPKQTSDDQFANARGVGWVPAGDVAADEDPPNNTKTRCLAIMKKHNVALQNRNQIGQALQSCDSLWFFMAAMNASGTTVMNQQTYLRGVNNLGTGYAPGMTFATSVSTSRHDGAAAARNLSYDTDCTCFHYTSAPYAVEN